MPPSVDLVSPIQSWPLKMKLTQRVIDALRPGKRDIVWDDALPRFAVRITEGSVAYVVDIPIGRKRRRVVLDSVSRIALGAARARAQEVLVAARRGIDLTAIRRKDEPTFAEVWRGPHSRRSSKARA